MTAPRVLLITGEYPPMQGGISGYTELLRSELELQGIQTVVLSSHASSADETVETWSWGAISTVREIVSRHRIDIVHVQYQAGAFAMHPVVNLLSRLIRVAPVVTTFHDLRPPYLFPKAGRVRFFTMRRMARWSKAVIVTNPDDRHTLSQAKIPSQLIPLGPSLPSPDARFEPEPCIGYFGFPSRQKGFDLLIQAIGRFPARERPPLCIVGGHPTAAGQHGFMSLKDAETLAAECGVELTWTGYLDAQAASNALSSCAVIAFPFPDGATQRSSALIAALQLGRTVVTAAPAQADSLTGLTRLPQLVQIPRGDPAQLKQALDAAITSPVAWQPLPSEYAWRSVAARHADLYQTLRREALD